MNDGDASSCISLLDRAWGPAYPEGVFSTFANIKGTAGGGVFGVDDGFSIGAISLVSSQSFSYQGDASYEYDNDGNKLRFGLFDVGAREFYDLKDISLSSNKLANISIQIFDAAIAQASKARAEIGAVQSRFETAIGNLSIAGENIAAARSRIADADFDVETAQLARQQILQNAGTAMVAQANSLPEQVLALIKAV